MILVWHLWCGTSKFLEPGSTVFENVERVFRQAISPKTKITERTNVGEFFWTSWGSKRICDLWRLNLVLERMYVGNILRMSFLICIFYSCTLNSNHISLCMRYFTYWSLTCRYNMTAFMSEIGNTIRWIYLIPCEWKHPGRFTMYPFTGKSSDSSLMADCLLSWQIPAQGPGGSWF